MENRGSSTYLPMATTRFRDILGSSKELFFLLEGLPTTNQKFIYRTVSMDYLTSRNGRQL